MHIYTHAGISHPRLRIRLLSFTMPKRGSLQKSVYLTNRLKVKGMCSDTIYPTRLSSPFISHPFPPLLLPFPISASSSFVIGFQDSWSFSTKPKKPGRDLLACCWEKKQHQRYLCLKLEKERKRSTKPLFLTNSEDFLDTPNQSKRIQRRNRIIDNRS